MANDDFWDEMILGQYREASTLDFHLSQRQESELMLLTDRGREEAAISTRSLTAGTRVEFVTNVGSVMSYQDPPESHTEGTIVMTRTADGDATYQDDLVFVKWDDGRFMPAFRQHLRLASVSTKQAASVRRRVATVGDLTDFLRAGSGTDLVHKATKDLWTMDKDENGELVISRLFAENGEPLKV